jgi:hypothetical protein
VGRSGCGSQIEIEHGQCPYLGLLHTLSEKWAEARRWAGGRVTGKKYKLPSKQRPDGTVAGSTKGLASRFYQLKTGHSSHAST